MTDINDSSHPTMTGTIKKISAFQIANGKLDQLGKQVAAHLQKMRAYEAKAQEKAGHDLRKADDHWNTVTQLLADAKAQCDRGGFKAFQKKYASDLGRSWIYELLAIGEGKKTVEEVRAETLKRVKKHRAKASVTPPVTDSAGVDVTPPSELDGPPPEPGKPATPENIFARRIGVGVKAPVDEALRQTVFKELEKALEDACKQPKPPEPKPESHTAVRAPESQVEAPASGPASKPQGDGPYSAGEHDRLRARVDELGAENRRLQIENVGLKNEVSELETVNRELRARIAELVEKSPASAAPPPITVNKQAEADNAVPPDASAEAMKAKMATLGQAADAPAVSPDAAPSDDLDVITFQGGVLAAVTGKRRSKSEPDAA